MGPSLAIAVRTEEVEENSCVKGAHRLLTEVVVVGLDLGASVVVRGLNGGVDQARVLSGELLKSQLFVL